MTMFGSIYPLIINHPLIKTNPWGDKICFTINLDGGTITPLIKKRCLVKPPPNTNKMWFCV